MRPSLILALLAFVVHAGTAFSAEVIPPKPPRHFNDFAGVTSVSVQQQLDRSLEQLEKTNSTQVVVAIYKKMQSDADIAEYTVRVAQKWGVGTEKNDNGAVLFVFVEDRKMYLQVGYGLEGAIPDITAKDITENRIKPHFRRNDYNSGMIAGVDSIIKAVGGEYQGTGRTVADGNKRRRSNWGTFFVIGMFILAAIASRKQNRGHIYGRRGHRSWGPIIWTGGGGGWGSSGRGGGGGWGGGFSGGGGSFGGGGAGSSW